LPFPTAEHTAILTPSPAPPIRRRWAGTAETDGIALLARCPAPRIAAAVDRLPGRESVKMVRLLIFTHLA